MFSAELSDQGCKSSPPLEGRSEVQAGHPQLVQPVIQDRCIGARFEIRSQPHGRCCRLCLHRTGKGITALHNRRKRLQSRLKTTPRLGLCRSSADEIIFCCHEKAGTTNRPPNQSWKSSRHPQVSKARRLVIRNRSLQLDQHHRLERHRDTKTEFQLRFRVLGSSAKLLHPFRQGRELQQLTASAHPPRTSLKHQ